MALDPITYGAAVAGANKHTDAEVNRIDGRLDNMQNIGRFLSLWDCTTGLPETNPSGYPYEYHTGDYFRVNKVATAGGVNYMPNGSSYEGEASTTTYTGDVAVKDIWFYDGANWSLQINHAAGLVQDVKINNASVVSNGTAVLPTETLQFVMKDGGGTITLKVVAVQ